MNMLTIISIFSYLLFISYTHETLYFKGILHYSSWNSLF